MRQIEFSACLVLFLLVLCTQLIVGDQQSSSPPSADSGDSGDDSQDAASPCEQIQSQNAKHIQVRCIGMLHSRLLLVTQDYQVYELPLSSLSATINRLYISKDDHPVPLHKKWPHLTSSSFYATASKEFYNCFTALDASSEYLLMTTKWDRCKCYGATYDIAGAKAYKGLTYNQTDDQVLISSDQLRQFYSLNLQGAKGLQMMRYHFQQDKVLNSRIVPDSNSTFFPLCAVGGSQIQVQKSAGGNGSSSAACTPLNWPVLKGFIAQGKFWLFGADYLFTFPQTVYEHGDPVNYDTIPFGQFIKCGGTLVAKQAPVAKMSPVKWALIIALLLLLALCCLCCLLWLARVAAAEQPKRRSKGGSSAAGKSGTNGKSDNKQNSQGKGSSAKQAQPDGSIRDEAGGPLYSLLTRQSKAKPKARSVRSGDVSRFGQLTRKKSHKPSRTRSARSSGYSHPSRLTAAGKSKTAQGSSKAKPSSQKLASTSKQAPATPHMSWMKGKPDAPPSAAPSEAGKGARATARSSNVDKPSRLDSKKPTTQKGGAHRTARSSGSVNKGERLSAAGGGASAGGSNNQAPPTRRSNMHK